MHSAKFVQLMDTEGTPSGAGTHDNETAVGWWKDSATEVDRDYLMQYLNTEGEDIAWDFIRSVYSTVSRTSIILIQVKYHCHYD